MFAHVLSPFIANTPMDGTATAALAAAVTRAHGFGFVGGGFTWAASSTQLGSLEKGLLQARGLLGFRALPIQENDDQAIDTLPIGVGFLTFHNDDAGIPSDSPTPPSGRVALRTGRPPNAKLIKEIKSAGDSWNLKVFVQICSVHTAVEAVNDGEDVIVAQGSDAGGHQFTSNSRIIALLPEVSDTVKKLQKEVPFIAAGGIMDGRGIAAALAFGIDTSIP
ncbi:2-nitropropane dioxygenase [Lipomyces kononenkoae]